MENPIAWKYTKVSKSVKLIGSGSDTESLIKSGVENVLYKWISIFDL